MLSFRLHASRDLRHALADLPEVRGTAPWSDHEYMKGWGFFGSYGTVWPRGVLAVGQAMWDLGRRRARPTEERDVDRPLSRRMRRLRSAVAVALIAAAPAAAAVSAPRGDPRGTIAFVRFSPRIGHPRIAVLGLAQRTVRRLPLPGQATEAPAWSPDGRLIAFVSGRNAADAQDIVGPAVLYVGTSDGRNLRRLTPSSARAGASSWSPDATRLVFVRSSPSGARSTLWTVGVDGSRLRRITNGSLDSEPSWSPDGRVIAFLRIDPNTFRGGVWVVHPDGSGLRRIIPRVNDAAEPVWSPDGTRLLVHDSRTVYSVRPDGRDLRALVHLAADAHGALEDPQPAWSPDGTWIVFCQFRRAAVSRSDLWTVRADGRGLRRLTRSPGLDTDPSWGS